MTRPSRPRWTVGFNWMPVNADAEIYGEDSWVGTGRVFFDTEKEADRFFRNVLPKIIGDAGRFKRPFHECDIPYLGAVHRKLCAKEESE